MSASRAGRLRAGVQAGVAVAPAAAGGAPPKLPDADYAASAVLHSAPVPGLDEADVGDETRAFHQGLPGYQPTPLRRCPELAAALDVREIWLKDETSRLGLPAFKILGTSYGVYRLLAQRVGEVPTWNDFANLRRWAVRLAPMTLAAATDGNHGRAVAHMAALLGFGAAVYVPAGTSAARVDAIRGEGASVTVVEGDYDDAVRRAAEDASDCCMVVSDTSWPGYTDVPTWVMDGYATIFAEIREQLRHADDSDATFPNFLVVPAGVGALLGSTLRAVKGRDAAVTPTVVSVEPMTADCVARSLAAGDMVQVPGPHRSIMAGLNCGTPSRVAWPRIRATLDGAVAIGDGWAERAMRDLAEVGVVAGETGAASLAGLTALRRAPELAGAARALGLDHSSRVLLVCTEGATDPVRYEQIVGRPAGRG